MPYSAQMVCLKSSLYLEVGDWLGRLQSPWCPVLQAGVMLTMPFIYTLTIQHNSFSSETTLSRSYCESYIVDPRLKSNRPNCDSVGGDR